MMHAVTIWKEGARGRTNIILTGYRPRAAPRRAAGLAHYTKSILALIVEEGIVPEQESPGRSGMVDQK
jgi:hypothetical protein